MTNIVVVQFSDNVQTSRDKRFNLTCLFRGPAEAVVTSNYIGAGWVKFVDYIVWEELPQNFSHKTKSEASKTYYEPLKNMVYSFISKFIFIKSKTTSMFVWVDSFFKFYM